MVLLMIVFQSCSWEYYTYIINRTTQTATIDVFLKEKSEFKTLPNQVKVANEVVKFKWGFRQKFDITQNVSWIDTSHFRFFIKPGSTIDLNDMTGWFVNGHPTKHVEVTVTSNKKIDTLITGFHRINNTFVFKAVGLTRHVLYFDIKN